MPNIQIITRGLGLATLFVLICASAGAAYADEGEIEIVSSGITSEFPDGMRFQVDATGENEITSIAVRFKTGRQSRGTYDYLDFVSGMVVSSELFFRTNTSARYIPPGTIITFNFEIEDSEGTRLETEPETFVYQDARFQWEEISEGPVTVAYHGPVKTRAEIILDAITETVTFMGSLLGADTEEPIRVNMYNNTKEMLEALPPGSTTIRRELITEGQAFTTVGTLLVLGGSRSAAGTASHEIIHILTHRAGDSVVRRVPQWLDEGLAEFGNVEPTISYDIALEFALETDRLLPITSLDTIPSDPEDVIIFYGEARSLVRFMVAHFGPALMKQLMAALKSGENIDDAVDMVYGVNLLILENMWRNSIRAPEYKPSDTVAIKPTPIARRTVLPYSLTPQARSETIGAVQSTPTSEPIVKTSTEETPEATVAPPPAKAEPTQEKAEPQGKGGACSAPIHGGSRALDLSVVAFLAGMVGLGLRRTHRR